MEIYEVLRKDHDHLKALFKKLADLDDKADRDERNIIIDEIRDELIPHSRAEETVFYNSLRSIEASRDEAMHSYSEHVEAETYLRALQAASMAGVGWRKAAEKLRDSVEHHIKEEESKIFNMAHQLFTKEEAEAMADVFKRLKPEVREQGFLQQTLDMVANLMPSRFSAPLRTYRFEKRI